MAKKPVISKIIIKRNPYLQRAFSSPLTDEEIKSLQQETTGNTSIHSNGIENSVEFDYYSARQAADSDGKVKVVLRFFRDFSEEASTVLGHATYREQGDGYMLTCEPHAELTAAVREFVSSVIPTR